MPGLLLALAAFALFWLFRAAEMTGGDSDQWCREIEDGVTWRKRQMLSFAFMQLNYIWTDALWRWNGRLAINLTSCIAGACFVYFVWRLLGGEKQRVAMLGLVFTAGIMQLFFGHLETYANSMACLMYFFLIVRRYQAGRLRAIHVAAAYSLGVGFHLVFWFLLPVFAVLLYHSRRRLRDSLEILFGLLPAILLTFLMDRHINFGSGEMVGTRFMQLFHLDPSMGKQYALFSWLHLREWLWFTGTAAHCTVFIVAWGLLARRFRRDFWVDMLGMSVLCFLLFTWIWYPDANRRDWDLFSFPGLPMALLAVECVRRVHGRKFSIGIGLVAGVSALLLSVKVIDAARLGARGEGTVLVHIEAVEGVRVAAITLDGRNKRREMYHILEGRHTVRVYQERGREIIRYKETFDLHPGEVYNVTVPVVYDTDPEPVP